MKRRFAGSPPTHWQRPLAPRATRAWVIVARCRRVSRGCSAKFGQAMPCSPLERGTSIVPWENSPCSSAPSISCRVAMKLNDPRILAALPELGVERIGGTSLAERTSLGIGGITDLLLIRRHSSLPDLIALLRGAGVAYKFLGGGTNLLVRDGELPWDILQLARQEPESRLEGNSAHVGAAADLGRTVTFCAKHDLGGMEGLIGVPGTVGGALRMNAGAYGTQIGSYVRQVELFRAAGVRIEALRENEISFEYRHTSFAPDDIMLVVNRELPSKS